MDNVLNNPDMKQLIKQWIDTVRSSVWGRVWLPLAANLLTVMVVYMLCRAIFLAENHETFSSLSWHGIKDIVRGGLRFDWAALCYTNVLYLVLLLMPLPYKETVSYQRGLKVLFIVTNGLAVVANLMDTVYFQYVGRRTTSSVFTEFGGDNVAGIIGIELLNHWYLTLAGVALIWAMWRLYRTTAPLTDTSERRRYYIRGAVQTIVAVLVVIFGIRGGIDPELRPINNRDAKNYVARPSESALVLNTPFSICRTIGKRPYVNPGYYPSEEAMSEIYTPLHHPKQLRRRKDEPTNVVILIMESFGSEYSALLNKQCPEGGGHTPFLDSLMQEGLTFEHSFANGRKSVDAQAAVLASIPMFVEPFFTSHAAMNDVEGIASLLKRWGYTGAYFHGADNGSLGIDAFAHTCGFDEFHGRTEYANEADYDGHWGIWDEEFLQYFGRRLTALPEPFIGGVFTLTSHHPFRIPDRYTSRFPEGELPIHKALAYADMSLKRFFEYARRQPWYERTLFVITGDHTNLSICDHYRTDKGRFEVPILFYHPTDKRLKGVRPGIAQHIDIMPTILGYLGYDKPYMAFGQDLLHTTPEKTFAVNWQNDIYQYFKDGLMLQFDGTNAVGLYDYHRDPMLETNQLNQRFPLKRQDMERELKAIIQQYMTRMNENRLVVGKTNKE